MRRTMATNLSLSAMVILGTIHWAAARDQESQPKPKPDTAEAAADTDNSEAGADDSANQSPSLWMEKKLKYSQAIFAALARGDLAGIESNARDMKTLGRIEAFVRRRPKGYRTQLDAFQFSNEELIRAARHDNLDGATLAFNQMTVSCVKCHKLLRNQESNSNGQVEESTTERE